MNLRNIALFAAVGALFVLTGATESWNTSLSILNFGLLSAIMALGVNMQWGYAGLFNTGIMGFVALGSLAVVLVAGQPVPEGWAAGGPRLMLALVLGVITVLVAILTYRRMKPGRSRNIVMVILLVGGFFAYRAVFDPASNAIEAFNPATAGNMGGMGLHEKWRNWFALSLWDQFPGIWSYELGDQVGWFLATMVTWGTGALLAAAAAWAIGKTALGLRSDYLAIATLGIAEIIISVMKNEDWLARGVKNIISLPRPWPVPYEVDLQRDPGFLAWVANWGMDPVTTSSIVVKLLYAAMFGLVLLALIWLSERALRSPWGRMMRAIRDNEVSAAAMGKNVTARHLQIFIIGSAVVGLAGAMMTSMEGQLVPGSYNPLRFTFLIWVMVIIGGSGNNWGSVLGGLLIGWLWLVAGDYGPALMGVVTANMGDGALKSHLIDAAPHMRLFAMGIILLLVLRFSPRGMIPEK